MGELYDFTQNINKYNIGILLIITLLIICMIIYFDDNTHLFLE
jgi:hypothetical protein